MREGKVQIKSPVVPETYPRFLPFQAGKFLITPLSNNLSLREQGRGR